MLRPDPYQILPPAHHTPTRGPVTLGPLVGAECARAGYAPDPEQQLILDDVFRYNSDGLPASFTYDVAGPRQQLKTGSFIQMAIGWLFVVPGPKNKQGLAPVRNINWSAHLRDTAVKSFGELADVIKGSHLTAKLQADRSDGIHTGKDVERILTADGRTLDVSARTDRGGRGLTGDRLALDEALYLTSAMMGALLPTLTARQNAQAVFGSTPGMANSEVWRQRREAWRAGRSPGVEWGTERPPCESKKCTHYPPEHPAHTPGCAMDRVDLWVAGSPLLGRVRPNGTGLSLARLQDLRNSMPPSEWGREFLGWWDEPADTNVFGDGVWSLATATWTDDEGATHLGFPPVADYPLATIGVAVAADLGSASIVGAGPRGEKVAVKVITHGYGYHWVVGKIKELRQQHPRVQVVYDPGGPTGVLTTELDKLKPSRWTRKVTFPQWKAACAGIWSGIRGQTVEHGGQPELNEAVDNAQKRDIVDRWVWERYGYDASPLEAATLAVWGAENEPMGSAYETRGVMAV